ncbi:MAG: 2-keto-4-pentenoate hydratase [Hyphomicrobiaceae bacterium]
MGELSERLWRARASGSIVEIDDIVEPVDMAAAYDVQAEIVAQSGYEVVGFKVGSTSAEAQRFLGTDEPSAGSLLAPYVMSSPAEFAVAGAQMPAIEGEFAFQLRKDLPASGAPYSYETVLEAIGGVAGAIEVVGTRIAGGLAGKGRFLLTADGGANIALVVGDWHELRPHMDLKTHDVTVVVNGAQAGHGQGAEALGDPLNVMVWLANQQATTGRGLRAGDIVSTGTCTGLAGVGPGDTAMADFGTLGRVRIAFS